MIVWVQVPSPAVKCERLKPLRNRGFGPFLRGEEMLGGERGKMQQIRGFNRFRPRGFIFLLIRNQAVDVLRICFSGNMF